MDARDDELTVSLCDEFHGLVKHITGFPGTRIAPELRNIAIGAKGIATILHF